jgi:hypothetical protein
VSRLLGLGLIPESDRKRLLRPKFVAQECLATLGPASGRVSSPSPSNPVVASSDLRAEHITKTDLAMEAVSLSLQLPALSESRLLELAEAAR